MGVENKMPKLKFFDVSAKKSFMSDKFTISRTKNGRRLAKVKSPLSGNIAVVFVAEDFKR